MSRTTHHPATREEWLALRANDITSTEVSALFGISPYTTLFELWHRKRSGAVVEIEENERMKWGTRLQDAIASGIADDHGWKVRRMDEYMRLPDHRIGSSFDFMATDDSGAEFLLEVKNVDSLQYRENWLVIDGELEAPVHIELQLQHQMLVSGAESGVIGALSGGNKSTLIRRTADKEMHAIIIRKVAAFWRSIAEGKEPAPEFPADADVVSRLFGFAEPGKLVNMDSDAAFAEMCAEYVALGASVKHLTEQRDSIKARLLMAIGDSEKALAGRYTVTAGMVAGSHIEYDRAPYRAFRVTQKKEKK